MTPRDLLLAGGVLGAAVAIGTDVVAGGLWDGYSFVSRSASDLGAIGSPTRPFVAPLELLRDLLLISFGVGLWLTSGPRRAARLTAGFVTASAVLFLVATLAPWHLAEPMGSPANTMNVMVMAPAVISLMLAIGCGAVAYSGPFRVYSIATLAFWLIADVWATVGSTPVLAGVRGPLVGVQERAVLYAYLLWVAVLAVRLMAPSGVAKRRRQSRHRAPQT